MSGNDSKTERAAVVDDLLAVPERLAAIEAKLDKLDASTHALAEIDNVATLANARIAKLEAELAAERDRADTAEAAARVMADEKAPAVAAAVEVCMAEARRLLERAAIHLDAIETFDVNDPDDVQEWDEVRADIRAFLDGKAGEAKDARIAALFKRWDGALRKMADGAVPAKQPCATCNGSRCAFMPAGAKSLSGSGHSCDTGCCPDCHNEEPKP